MKKTATAMQTIMVITPTEDLTHYHGRHSVSQHLPTLPSLTHLPSVQDNDEGLEQSQTAERREGQ